MSIPILTYHQIDTPPPRGTPLRGLIVSPASFARQMFVLKCLGYRGLSMRQLEPYLKGEQQGRVVGITFDDGYRNNLQYALPLLKKHGFSATCYAVSGMLGASNSWDRENGVAHKPLMTIEECRDWLHAGMEIGSHTRSHADLTQLEADAARTEIADSRLELENSLGCEVRHFCYPYGRMNPQHCEMAKQAGYRSATTMRRGRAQAGDNLFTLRRILAARAMTVVQLAWKIASSYEDRRG